MVVPSFTKPLLGIAAAISVPAVPTIILASTYAAPVYAVADSPQIASPSITALNVDGPITNAVNPVVALSVLGSSASLAALCATASAPTANNGRVQSVDSQTAPTIQKATNAEQPPAVATVAPGCVLPAVDQPAVVSEFAPLALGISPLFALLGALPPALGAALSAGNGNGSQPISPA